MSKKNKNRSGDTKITSVSVSQEFAKLIEQYNMSPTECFRRGVAVTLCDLGVEMYQSEKNEKRLKYVQEFLKNVDADKKLKEDYEKIKLFEKVIENFKEIQQLTNRILEDNKDDRANNN